MILLIILFVVAVLWVLPGYLLYQFGGLPALMVFMVYVFVTNLIDRWVKDSK